MVPQLIAARRTYAESGAEVKKRTLPGAALDHLHGGNTSWEGCRRPLAFPGFYSSLAGVSPELSPIRG